MRTTVYCKNGFVVARDLTVSKETVTTELGGLSIPTPKGVQTAGGLILLEDRLATSKSCHELEVVASKTPDLSPGDHIIVFLGGDDGGVSANGISAFPSLDGEEVAMVHDRFIWAKVKDGEILPRGRIALTERDDAAFRWHVLGPASLLHSPSFLMEKGVSATGADDRSDAGAAYAVTALYERVLRVGPAVKDLARGETVCFSPSYAATRLERHVTGEPKRFYHLVDSEEVYFAEYH